MIQIRVLRCAAFALAVALSPLAQAASEEADVAEARQLYEEGRWTAAWDAYASLADRGNVEAARVVLRMTRFGPQLYKQSWAAAADRLARWQQVASGQQPVRTASQ